MNLLSPVITDSGWIYSVGSLYSRANNIFGRPMYYPDKNGERLFRKMRYRKYQRQSELNLLPKQPYGGCIQIDPWSVLLPAKCIVEIIDVRHSFAQWLNGHDSRVNIIKNILDAAGIKKDQCGLGGSAGIGCETSASDVDILIFGNASMFAFKRAIEDALLKGQISLMTQSVASSYAKRYAQLYGIDQSYLQTIFASDLTKVYYRGRKISFIFVYNEDERDKIPRQLYDDSVSQANELCIKARIIDGSASWLYPRKYVVEQQSGQIHQVWSHHWLRDPVTPLGTLVEIVGCDLGDGLISLTDIAHHIVPLRSLNNTH